MQTCHAQTLQEEASAILEECHMVLPGVAALLGFQLIAVFTEDFHAHFNVVERWAHGAAVLLTIVAIVLEMAPAAYHRQAERHRITREFVSLSSRLVAAGMLALMLALSIEAYLVGSVLSSHAEAGVAAASFVVLFAGGLWFAFPRWKAAHAR